MSARRDELALVRELEVLIDGGGHADLERTRSVHELCAELRGPRERVPWLRAIEERLVQLYSERRHAEFPGGAEGLRKELRADIAKLRISIQRATP